MEDNIEIMKKPVEIIMSGKISKPDDLNEYTEGYELLTVLLNTYYIFNCFPNS